jgi:MYXO-CTERM domain-containing protein
LATYSLALLALVRLVLSSDRISLSLNTAAGTTLGLGLAAFYIVPAAYQRRFIDHALAQAQSALITDNFLFHRTGDAAHDAVLRTASIIATGLLLTMFAALSQGYRLSRRSAMASPSRVLIPLTALTLAIGLLLIPASTPVWQHAPSLAFLQFPWRFVAILAPALAFALACAVRSDPLWMKSERAAGLQASLVALLLIGLSFHVFYQPCEQQDTVAARLALFHSPLGTEGTDDYIPNTVDDADALGRANPPFWLAPDADAPPPGEPAAGPVPSTLDLKIPQAGVLILNLRDYPAWQIRRNGQLLATRLARADGLLATPLPAGPAHLVLTYAHTPDQTAGNVVTAVALAVLLYLLLRRRRS